MSYTPALIDDAARLQFVADFYRSGHAKQAAAGGIGSYFQDLKGRFDSLSPEARNAIIGGVGLGGVGALSGLMASPGNKLKAMLLNGLIGGSLGAAGGYGLGHIQSLNSTIGDKDKEIAAQSAQIGQMTAPKESNDYKELQLKHDQAMQELNRLKGQSNTVAGQIAAPFANAEKAIENAGEGFSNYTNQVGEAAKNMWDVVKGKPAEKTVR